MKKTEFIKYTSELSGIPRYQLHDCLEAILLGLEKLAVAGDEVTFLGFGKFYTKDYKPRSVGNFTTGETTITKPSRVLKFAASKVLKQRLTPDE